MNAGNRLHDMSLVLSKRLAIGVFAAGCAALQLQPALPAMTWVNGEPTGLPTVLRTVWPLLLLFVLWAFIALAPNDRRQGLRQKWYPGLKTIVQQTVLLVLIGVSGFYYAAWRAELRLSTPLLPMWEGRDLTLKGRVSGLPETRSDAHSVAVSFVLDVTTVETTGAQVPQRVRLSAIRYRNAETPADQSDALPIQVTGGDCLQLHARLYRPHGSLNPGGMDYEGWLLERGIRATGHVQGLPVMASGCNGTVGAHIDRVREWIRGHLMQSLTNAPFATPYAGVVIALAVGDQEAIPSSQWTLFRQSGTTHLFSVSGLHITLFSALVYALVRLIWRRFPHLNLKLPAHRAGLALGLLASAIYTVLAGFEIPAQRTLAMLTGGVVLAWLDHTATPSRLLAAALLMVVLLDPWAALSPGFWLSFSAVAILLWAGMRHARLKRPVWQTWAHAQWAITLGLTPLLLSLFQEVSLVSPLANAVAIPLISLLGVPLSLLAAAVPWDVLTWPAHGVVYAVMWVLGILTALPQPVFNATSPGLLALGLALIGAVLLLLPRGFPARWLGLVMCVPLFFPRLPAPEVGEAWISVLDVGQGNAVIVRTAHHTLLVDAGPRYGVEHDAGQRIVAPALWALGIKQLDGLVLTHDDMDHSGGVSSVLASHRPIWLLTPLAGRAKEDLGEIGRGVMHQRPDAIRCQAGQVWRWDDVEFNVLHPPEHQYAMSGYDDNDRSCVIEVTTGGSARVPKQRALLAGDVGRLSEMNLIERNVLRPVDLLVVPHHGSKSSSSEAFLMGVQPRLAVIPVGHRNRYGHPHAEVLARYRQHDIRVMRTDREGALTVYLNNTLDPTLGTVKVESARDEMKRYWHADRR